MERDCSNEFERPGTTFDANQTGNFVYVLRCRDGSFYTGWTNRLEKRLKAHQEGTGAKYTRTRKPVQLVCYWQFETSSEARRFEIQFKRLPRAKKIEKVDEQRLLNRGNA